MHFQYVVAPPSLGLPVPQAVPPSENQSDLLRELVAVQKEQLAYLRAMHEAHNNIPRWQQLLLRWQEDFPGIGDECQKVIPIVEGAFLKLLEEVTRRLADEDQGDLDNEFALAEFLDRYGMRLAQLGNVLNILGPIADASRTTE